MNASAATWEKARTGKDELGWKLGGSSAGIVLGKSPFCDRFTLWARMRDGMAEPEERELEEEEMSEVQDAGNILEDAILNWYGKRTGRLVIPPPLVAEWMLRPEQHVKYASAQMLAAREIAQAMLPLASVYYGPDDGGHVVFRSRKNPLHTGTFDAFAKDPELGYGVIDAKNVQLRKKRYWDSVEPGEGVPAHYVAQNHHYMLLVPFEWTGWATLFGGQHLGVYDMKRDEKLIETIVQEEIAFAEYLDGDVAPPQSVTERSLDTLKQLFPDVIKGTVVEWRDDTAVYTSDGVPISPDVFDRDWLNATFGLRDLHKRKKHLEAIVRYQMGEAQEIVLPNGTRYEKQKRKRQGTEYTQITRHAAPKEEVEGNAVERDKQLSLVDPKLADLETALTDLFGDF